MEDLFGIEPDRDPKKQKMSPPEEKDSDDESV